MERAEILKLLSEGKITVDEATMLLTETKAKNERPAEPEVGDQEETTEVVSSTVNKPKAKNGGMRWLHVHVDDLETRRSRVRVNIPLPFLRAGLRIGTPFLHNKLNGYSVDDIMQMVDTMEIGTIVEVDDEDSGDHVHVFID